MPTPDDDPELNAIVKLLDALNPLDSNARLNVLRYVFERLKIEFVAPPGASSSPAQAQGNGKPEAAATKSDQIGKDIRTFREDKSPSSAIEMAAVVAYYLNHLAPIDGRKDTVSARDINKFFHQANFPLPKSAPMTLVHTKNAGYLDQVGHGQYRLNPVGYNLVAHRLPTPSGSKIKSTKKPPKSQK